MPHNTPHSRSSINLRTLFPRASFVDCADILVADATDRSDECRPGLLFAALPGTQHDGVTFAAEAVRHGATAVLTTRPLVEINVPQCVVPDVRSAYSQLCAALAGCPTQHLSTIGVTGTNGKTTVTWLLRSILQAAGHRCGLLGTIEYSDGWNCEASTLTTPDAKTLQTKLAGMRDRQTGFAAMELSSHALDQSRAAGAELDVAVITNLTQDHFDYHNDFASYRAAKSRILELLRTNGRLVLNADDPHVRALRDHAPGSVEIKTFGFTDDAEFKARILDESLQGTRFLLKHRNELLELRTPLIGRHNVANCLAAVAAAAYFGITLDDIAVGIASLDSVPGRMERVDIGQSYAAFVDYAHTGDALQRSISTLNEFATNRVICVFGAGGDRDRTKRPLLGRAASESDICIVTSDNPRSEDPGQIIDDIIAGIPAGHPQVHVETDRELAIRKAVQMAGPGDVILVAGKGHEHEQMIGDRRIPFDDRAELRRHITEQLHATTDRPVRLPA